jgi:hypothetical protein
METFNLYLGDRLGWFDVLAEGPATATELAERTNTQTPLCAQVVRVLGPVSTVGQKIRNEWDLVGVNNGVKVLP